MCFHYLSVTLKHAIDETLDETWVLTGAMMVPLSVFQNTPLRTYAMTVAHEPHINSQDPFPLLLSSGLFLLALVVANLLGGVVVSFPKGMWLGLSTPALQCSAGIFCFPLVFLLTDWIHERWGKQTIVTVSFVGFILLLLLALFLQALAQLPMLSKGVMLTQDWFQALNTSYSRAVVASVVAYAVGQACDILIFRVIHKGLQQVPLTQGVSPIQQCLLKALGSTAISQVLDTSVFFILFGWGTLPASLLVSLILGDYTLKAMASLLSLPVLAYLNQNVLKTRTT